MGWNYDPPDKYECLSCGHIYPYKRDTVWMATHKGSPGCCPKCQSGLTKKTKEKSAIKNIDFEWNE